MQTIRRQILEDGVCVLTFDRPDSPANIFDLKTLEELEANLTAIRENPEVKGLVLISAKPTIFIAGADLKAIENMGGDQLETFIDLGHRTFTSLRELRIPTVAAIHGACVGGGFEVALACDWRIATNDKATKIGLPETKLGILPAWGGTTRLPRLIGLPGALDIILGGKTVAAKSALKRGMIDGLAPRAHLVEDARKYLARGKRKPEFPPLGMRRKLRALAAQLGAPRIDVLRTYGFTESKLAWAECPFPEDAGSAGYHIHPDLALIEIVDPKTGEPRGEGEPGEIVFTPLDARGSVVLRYRTGDCVDGGLFYEPCPFCGRVVPRLVGEISRNSEMRELRIEKLKGTLIDFNYLEHVLDNVEHVGTWQVELRKRHDDPLEVDELILHVSSDGYAEETLRHTLEERCMADLELHPNRIEFHSVEEMRRRQGVGTQLKEQRVVDHRPGAAPGGTPAANTNAGHMTPSAPVSRVTDATLS